MASLNSDTMSDQCCTRLVFEAVKENSVSKFKLAESTYDPLQLMASLVHCNDNGETPLTIAMNVNNNSLIDELRNFYSRNVTYLDWRNESLMTQYSFAIEQLAHQISIVEFVEFFFKGSYPCTDWMKIIVRTFSKSTKLNRQNKIIALELIGATLFLTDSKYYRDKSLQFLGLDCWRKAVNLRYYPADGEPLLPKTPDVSVPSVASSAVFGSVVEVTSEVDLFIWREEFEYAYCTPYYAFVPNRHSIKRRMKVQALLVIRRICNQANHGHPNSFYLEILSEFALDLKEQENFQDKRLFANICLLILEQMTDPKMLSSRSLDIFISALHDLSSFLMEMLEKPPGYPGREELSYPNLLAATKFTNTIAKFFQKSAVMYAKTAIIFRRFKRIPYFAELVFNFVAVLESISPQITNEEKQHMEEYYSNIIRNFFSQRTTTALHVAVKNRKQKTLNLILKLGANPNAINEKGRTPLHILARSKNIHLDEKVSWFQALVDAGTHLDIAADDGETVLSILKETVMLYKREKMIVDPYYESLLNTVFPLSCFCARVIRRHGIPFDRLPLRLQEFVTQH